MITIIKKEEYDMPEIGVITEQTMPFDPDGKFTFRPVNESSKEEDKDKEENK